ncbi:3-hydroxyacyl-CoA dehydrogenase / 3a,7a,12a-trihydroxy-5b-cholest-24-enoyl-CoA hydratase [Solimonas aquatica]|uniref:3-hydroxyacyl-CoA dehydrogenase / 3a,7a,12a-trihydroxy-5b-cholest-24-enoyl-CoA hydratase n=1 Tax=Solimonas aquatica TaxID=489703 RepID=A0A1H8ZRI8_9GAMM|nr:peroxisomal multifunctional enzyme type 2 [Solimonas aquatica]SEP67042.1 3-hydroxyacyl-CoA dehydrogenase / 3a,7a,12a-trihydroxy-5b-cholest-24-enoyl-CoA hydratase [Solimonas aquatica]
MSSELRYDGKVAIITGAGNGLGRQHALMFAARGARVVVNDLGGGIHGEGKSSAAADKVVEEIRAAGGEAVANYDSVEDGDRIVQTALDAFGTLDIVVNNAGILRDSSFHKMTQADWDLIVRVHLHGAFRVSHAAWPILRDKGYGRIIMTTSAAGIYGNFGQANYSAAKLALVGLANTLAQEGRAKNIHVNTIAPIAGSRLTETVLPPELIAALKPEYVSPLLGWLCHEDCKESGSLFEVGAGYIGKLRWERSKGRSLPLGRPFSAEDVARHWAQIGDFTDAEHPGNINESMAPLLANMNSKSLGGNEFIDLDQAMNSETVIDSQYDQRDVALYALGVGAAPDPLDDQELSYVYELKGDRFQVLPTYAVMPASNAMLALAKEGKQVLKGLNFGFERLLHGEQYTEIKQPLKGQDQLRHSFRLKAAYDKAPHAVVVIAVTSRNQAGEEVAYNETTMFVRGAGGWGGDRGPAGETLEPPAREPDAVIEERTDANQALLYRLSGDWNPLHADPAFAKAFGFDKPILHGLCTYGYVARHVIKAFLGNDARRFKSIRVRFADNVFPGQTLVTRMWRESATRVIVETRVKENDKIVIKNAAVEFYEQIPVAASAKPAAAQPPADAGPSAGELFGAIALHLQQHKGLGEQIKTVFQFRLKSPDSDWYLDLKSGDGAVQQGLAAQADVTLELADADFIAMATGKADPNKLYFGGKMKVSGNVMASQKLGFLQKLDPKLLQQTRGTRAAAAEAAPPADASGSATIFAAIGLHLQAHPGMGAQIKTVFQFQLKQPDSSWVIDLKSGDGRVFAGVAEQADVKLEMADEDFLAMASGKADPNKLYFGGKMKVSGNVMASQKLGFLQKLDPKLLQQARGTAAAAPRAPAAAASALSPAASRSAALLERLQQKLAQDSTALAALKGKLLRLNLREPEASWLLDCSGAQPSLKAQAPGQADAVFGIRDEDLYALLQRQAPVRSLYQQGRLRVDGDVRLAPQLALLAELL